MLQKCIEWKTDSRMTPEMAFSHPFISKAVNELKCLRTGSQGATNGQAQGAAAQGAAGHESTTRNTAGNARTTKANQQQQS